MIAWFKGLRIRRCSSIHPFATKYAMLKTKEDIEGVLIKGFDSTYNFSHLQALY